MDGVELQTLRSEILDDVRVAREAFARAVKRFERKEPVGYEACAHQLCRMFNAIEQIGLRVAKAFENCLDDEKGWHTGLLNRLSLRIQGVRPALFPQELKLPLHELRGFRHVVVHAYELELDPDKLNLVLKYARQMHEALPGIAENFIRQTAEEQDIAL